MRKWAVCLAAEAAAFLLGMAAGRASIRPLESTPQPKRPVRAGRLDLPDAPAERLRMLDGIIRELPGTDPDRQLALVERARLLLEEAKSPTLALADLDTALQHPEGDHAAEALHLRAVAHSELGEQTAALEDARLFLRLFPRSWRAAEMALLACDILESTARTGEAIALLEEVLASDPTRLERARLDPGERGRYPARLEKICLKLGQLYLGTGQFGLAEAAFELVASPQLGRYDFGETWRESPQLAEAKVGRLEAILRQADARSAESRNQAKALQDVFGADTSAGRRLAGLLGRKLPGPWEALHKAERGDLSGAAKALSECASPADARALQELAAIALKRAWFDPKGALELGSAIRAYGTSEGTIATAAVARARAFWARKEPRLAKEELMGNSSIIAALELAELARRTRDAELAHAALSAVADHSELAMALLERESR